MPPEYASRADVPTGIPRTRPSSDAADSDKPLPQGEPGGNTLLPVKKYEGNFKYSLETNSLGQIWWKNVGFNSAKTSKFRKY